MSYFFIKQNIPEGMLWKNTVAPFAKKGTHMRTFKPLGKNKSDKNLLKGFTIHLAYNYMPDEVYDMMVTNQTMNGVTFNYIIYDNRVLEAVHWSERTRHAGDSGVRHISPIGESIYGNYNTASILLCLFGNDIDNATFNTAADFIAHVYYENVYRSTDILIDHFVYSSTFWKKDVNEFPGSSVDYPTFMRTVRLKFDELKAKTYPKANYKVHFETDAKTELVNKADYMLNGGLESEETEVSDIDIDDAKQNIINEIEESIIGPDYDLDSTKACDNLGYIAEDTNEESTEEQPESVTTCCCGHCECEFADDPDCQAKYCDAKKCEDCEFKDAFKSAELDEFNDVELDDEITTVKPSLWERLKNFFKRK